MKKGICFLLIVCLLFSGCSFPYGYMREPVTFHYLCSRYQEDLCCVIASEEREASGHSGDLSYLLALYLMGPSEDELLSPLPAGTQILSVQTQDNAVRIELSELNSDFSDVDFSLACACLTLTCLDVTVANSVTVQSGSRSVTMDSSSLSVSDGGTGPS